MEQFYEKKKRQLFRDSKKCLVSHLEINIATATERRDQASILLKQYFCTGKYKENLCKLSVLGPNG